MDRGIFEITQHASHSGRHHGARESYGQNYEAVCLYLAPLTFQHGCANPPSILLCDSLRGMHALTELYSIHDNVPTPHIHGTY